MTITELSINLHISNIVAGRGFVIYEKNNVSIWHAP